LVGAQPNAMHSAAALVGEHGTRGRQALVRPQRPNPADHALAEPLQNTRQGNVLRWDVLGNRAPRVSSRNRRRRGSLMWGKWHTPAHFPLRGGPNRPILANGSMICKRAIRREVRHEGRAALSTGAARRCEARAREGRSNRTCGL